MSFSIAIILMGILAIPGMILAKKPEAKQLLDKITPYTGWVGLGGFVWGIWNLISMFRWMDMLTSGDMMSIIWWVVSLCCVLCQFVLGFMLGYGLIAQYAFKTDALKAKGEAILAKLAPMQGKFGIFAIIVGLVDLVLYFML